MNLLERCRPLAGADEELVPVNHNSELKDNIDMFEEFTPNKQLFLLCFAENGSIKKSCEAVGVSRIAYYQWMHRDENFRKAFEVVKQIAIQSLEDEVVHRGKDGVVEDVWYKGEKVGQKIVYSDTLLMFYLNGNAPEKYRNRHEVTAPGDGLVLSVSALDELVKD